MATYATNVPAQQQLQEVYNRLLGLTGGIQGMPSPGSMLSIAPLLSPGGLGGYGRAADIYSRAAMEEELKRSEAQRAILGTAGETAGRMEVGRALKPAPWYQQAFMAAVPGLAGPLGELIFGKEGQVHNLAEMLGDLLGLGKTTDPQLLSDLISGNFPSATEGYGSMAAEGWNYGPNYGGAGTAPIQYPQMNVPSFSLSNYMSSPTPYATPQSEWAYEAPPAPAMDYMSMPAQNWNFGYTPEPNYASYMLSDLYD